MPDISVIVPIYNVENYLRKCIDSILSQTHSDFELILINDGSLDGCGDICNEYKSKDSRIKVIHQKNQGTGIARNNGMSVAIGKYIYFCDPDDYMLPTLLAENLKIAEKYQANIVIFGYYNVIYQNNNQLITGLSSKSRFLESKEEFRNEFGDLFKKNIMYTLWNKLYNRDFLNNSNCIFYNQKVGQDTIFNYKVYENLDRVYVNDKKYYFYVVNRNESSTNVFRKNKFEIRYKETIEFENLLTNWGYKDKYYFLIKNDWIITLFAGINNLFNVNSPYKDREKKDLIKQIISTPKIKNLLNDVKIREMVLSVNHLEIYFLKRNLINAAFYLIKFKRLLKGN